MKKISNLNITQVKVVHDIGHENLFKEGNVGIVLTLKERVAPGVDLITQITKLLAKVVFLALISTYQSSQCLSQSEFSSLENQKTLNYGKF